MHKLKDQEHFVEMLGELAPLLAELPRGLSQEIVKSLAAISRLLNDVELAEFELERKLALIEAEQIIAER
ncbi:MAG TPA: hypothetical protein VMW79_05535 [Anaerolineae bacterium]|nr:hypothetical protein [Anaerolineae bacterium]